MGRDKARVDVGGLPLIERLAGQLRPTFTAIYIAAAEAQAFDEAGARVIPDAERLGGPLAAIGNALAQIPEDRCFVVACDTVDVPLDVVAKLIDASEGNDGAIARTPDGRAQPLFGVYCPTVIPIVQALLEEGERSMMALVKRAAFGSVDVDENTLRTFNTPEEFTAVMRDGVS